MNGSNGLPTRGSLRVPASTNVALSKAPDGTDVAAIVARWLVEQRAEQVVLSARTGNAAHACRHLSRELAAMHAHIDVVACDIDPVPPYPVATAAGRIEPRHSSEADGDVEELPAGTLVSDRYRIVGLLGRGGMGTVFEAAHVHIGKRFALKVLRTHSPADVERFERELQTLATLHSEHIVSIVDSGRLPDGRPYFVMERLYGDDLRALLDRTGPLSVGRAVTIALAVCRALQAVHRAGIVHRDLKPENVFIARSDGGRDVVKLLDFGVAKHARHDDTSPGVLVGTLRYMAPEQISGDQPIDAPTDVFAMGVMLYECLAGQVPFRADTRERLLFAIINDAPPPLEGQRPSVPPVLAQAVGRTLAKRPEDRPLLSELTEELSRCVTVPDTASGARSPSTGAEAPAASPSTATARLSLNGRGDARPAARSLRSTGAGSRSVFVRLLVGCARTQRKLALWWEQRERARDRASSRTTAR